ncbi:MAG: hypothetical protein JWM32_30 [Verrucomicrobia bacterium]|nr:hypothetical protein [Verrucomicrobiota bacterium]
MPRKTADQWFAEYGERHRHHANELIHWICVPVIFFSVLGFVWAIPLPEAWDKQAPWFNWSLVAIIATTIFYLRLSVRLTIGLAAFMMICQTILLELDFYARWPVWRICLVLFAAAWIGQFIGHRIEGKKPSFPKDPLFLLIGPAWLMSKVYRKVKMKY